MTRRGAASRRRRAQPSARAPTRPAADWPGVGAHDRAEDGPASARGARPLILTLQLDAASAAWFEARRRSYFPVALNHVPAHLTLFHALPGEAHDAVVSTAGRLAPRAPFAVAVTGLMPLGRGVAYALASPALLALRTALAEAYAPTLTRQDRERFRPHITVQNKVSPAEARHTLEHLIATFTPFEATAEGLQFWHYDGGPWSPAGAIAFG